MLFSQLKGCSFEFYTHLVKAQVQVKVKNENIREILNISGLKNSVKCAGCKSKMTLLPTLKPNNFDSILFSIGFTRVHLKFKYKRAFLVEKNSKMFKFPTPPIAVKGALFSEKETKCAIV